MTCLGMCGSGARTGMLRIPVGLPSIRKGLQRAWTACSAAAVGSAPGTGRRSAQRFYNLPTITFDNVGFRVVLAPGQP